MRRSRGRAVRAWLLTLSVAAVGCGSDVRPRPDVGAKGAGGNTVPDASTGGAAGDGGAGGTAGMAGDGGLVHPELCGNGVLDPGERCDDGNKTNGDGCDGNCRYTCVSNADCSDGDFCNGPETCGDDHVCSPSAQPVADGEVCGDSSKCQGGVCLPADPDCGDGLIERPTEECEDGNTVNGDGCDNCRFTCVKSDKARDCSNPDPCPGIATCNDDTHRCVPGTPPGDLVSCGTGKACLNQVCTDKYCGNKKIDGTEECDDGNQFTGDGCEPNCKFSCVATDKARDCHSDNTCIASGTCDAQTHVCSPLLPKTAGTACGTGNDCVEGNCIAPVCGDGIKAPGEACDDGNAVNGNAINGDACSDKCTPTCKAPSDCGARAPVCRMFACNGGACSIVSDSGQNGNTCDAGNGSGTCKDGACTSGTCGDGNVVTGEQCDDGNTTNGDGCDSNCRYSCQADADCDDKDPCNGVETCGAVTSGKKCGATAAPADGTSCGGGTKICLHSSCRPSFCGDSFTDKSRSESCDPPNTVGCNSTCKALATCQLSGNWALKITAKVSWTGGVLVDGTGEIDQWALFTINQPAGNTAFAATQRPCGIILPDFHTTMQFGSEWYGITFPDAAFDSTKMPTFGVTGQLSNLAPGAAFQTTSAAVFVGLDVGPPATAFDAWPASYTDLTAANGYSPRDVDGDSQPGITAVVKTGTIPAGTGMYQNIIEDVAAPHSLTDPGRASKLYVAIRQIASNKGTLTSCDEITGSTTALIDNHLLGCLTDQNTACPNADIVDGARPFYTVQSATFMASRLGTTTSCAAVRSKVP